VNRIALSETMKIAAAAKRMRAEGHDVIDLSAGEPDFTTPEHICRAAKRAIEEGFTHYTQNPGLPELRAAIAGKLAQENGVSYDPDSIIVTAGAKQALFNACAVLLEEGDRVVVPSPYWVSYPEMVKFFGATPVIVDTGERNAFRLTLEVIRPHLDGAAMIFLNSPSNPTGAVVARSELLAIANACVRAGVTIVSDEIYEKLIYDGSPFACVASLSPEIKQHTVVVNGFSKAYAMTGWRVGYAAGPVDVIKAMSRVQSHSTSNACAVAQVASIEAITGPQDAVVAMARAFAERRDAMVRALAEVPGWRCAAPDGAFYVFPNVTSSFGMRAGGRVIDCGVELATYLIEEAKVAAVPGDAFGAPGHLRFSFAEGKERIVEGIARVRDAVGRLRSA
jgi:aspartate aminotransferase